jgi:hypothetical protein
MAQPLSYYQNQLAENVIPAINNSTIQVPAQLQGSLIAYDNINDLFKQELVTGTVNTILYQSLITQNVAVVNTPLPITGAVNVNVVGDQVTANVSVVNFPSNQTVTVSNTPLPITGNVNISSPLDISGNVKVDIVTPLPFENAVNINTIEATLTTANTSQALTSVIAYNFITIYNKNSDTIMVGNSSRQNIPIAPGGSYSIDIHLTPINLGSIYWLSYTAGDYIEVMYA